MTRISDLSLHQLTLAQTLATQSRLADLQIQVSSGQKAQRYTTIASDAHRLVSLQDAHSRTAQYLQTNQIVDSRLTTMETNISQMFDSATQFRTLLVNALNNNNGEEMSIGTEATNFKEQFANLLNVQVDGRYLFSGSRTDTKPVDLTGWSVPPNLTPPLTLPLPQYKSEYYKGDGVQQTAEIDTNQTVDYGITADADAFDYILRAAHYVETAGTPPDRDTLETALALINTALGTDTPNPSRGAPAITRDLADLRSLVGTSRRAIEQANTRHNDFTLQLEQNIGDIQNVDVAQALTELSSQQTQLQASYMTLSQLSQLSLLQFLK
jgi:flagellar hook-associated protein 3 FlgL